MSTKRYKKKKRILNKVSLIAILFLTIFWAVPKIITASSDIISTVISHNENSSAKYDASTPTKLNTNEVKNRLYTLSEKYPEFKDVCENIDEYPETLLLSLCNTPEMIEFVKNYPTAAAKANGNITTDEMSEGIPLLLQWDKRWRLYNSRTLYRTCKNRKRTDKSK